MATITRLVRNDYGSQWSADLTDKESGLPIDLTNAVSARMYFRAKGAPAVLATITLALEAPVTDGRVSLTWPAGALNQTPGHYEGEIEITLNNGGTLTVYDLARFYIREDVGP